MIRCIIFVTIFVNAAIAARILGIFHMPSYSHFILGEAIFKKLAERGHEVTVISPYPQKTPVKNYRDISVEELLDVMKRDKRNMFEENNMSLLTQTIQINTMGLMLTEKTFANENVQRLLKSNETFDLIILEQFLNEAQHGFGYHFKAPRIVVSTLGANLWVNRLVGNPASPSYVPDIFLSYTQNMNFFQRMANSLSMVLQEIIAHGHTFPQQTKLMQKYIPNAPHVYDLIYNTSLILLNSHVSYKTPVPIVPNMVQIGGFHIQEPKALPADLATFLDNAKEGVIYFSMGSNLRSADMNPKKLSDILKVFSRLKVKVLWKWEDENLPGRPSNVKIGKWLPQRDILAHPNVKVFITHGGLLSTTEAVYRGVPIVGIPIFGDQQLNVAEAVSAGYAVLVNYNNLNEQTFEAALKEIIENPKYTENVKRRSSIMKDRQIKPLDNAMYWIEYVIKYKGAPHLQTAAINLSWYQYLLLDVILCLIAVVFTILFVFYKIMKKIFSRKSEPKKKVIKVT